jgi:prepilin peptidase CpaA
MSSFHIVGLLLCAIAAVCDLRNGRIPNLLTLPVLLLAPVAHGALAFASGAPPSAAIRAVGLSIGGLVLCGFVPVVMWRLNALGGGDVKLFAALGALLLPSFGFEVELYVLVTAALVAPIQSIYRGNLLRLVGNVGQQLVNPLKPRGARKALDPALVSWFRLGPCFFVGFAAELAMHWRQPW